MGGTHKESPEHDGHEREEKAEYPPVDVAHGRLTDTGRRYYVRQYPRRKQLGQGKHNQCHGQQEINSLIENGTDFPEITFSVAAGNQNLRADAETESQHEDGKVIYARNGRSTQFHFAHPSHEGRIGHADKLFHEQTNQDGVGHLPYFAVGIFRMHKKRVSDDGEM